jgi:hypothetical protein
LDFSLINTTQRFFFLHVPYWNFDIVFSILGAYQVIGNFIYIISQYYSQSPIILDFSLINTTQRWHTSNFHEIWIEIIYT